MTGLPTVQVLLDDGTGTFPYDITTLARIQFDTSRGRQDEQSQVYPGQCTLLLDNIDGRFTPGSTIIATPSPIVANRRIRVKLTANATTVNRFTGYVQQWPVTWPSGDDQLSAVPVLATDGQARAQLWVLKSIIEQEVLEDGPAAYYVMNEPEGATAAADSSGNQVPSMLPNFNVTFGDTSGSVTSAVFTSAGSTLDRPRLITSAPGFSVVGTVFAFSVASLSATTTTIASLGTDLVGTGFGIFQVRFTGVLSFSSLAGISLSSAASVDDGGLHVAEVQYSAGTWTLYLDGSPVDSTAGSAPTLLTTLSLGNDNPNAGSVVKVADFACFSTAPGATRAAAHATAIRTGFAGESGTARITRLAGYANLPVGTLDTSLTNVAAENIGGKSATSAISDVVDAEMGLWFFDGSGNLTFHNRTRAVLKTSPDITFDANVLAEDTAFIYDMQGVLNHYEVTALGTGNGAQVIDNFASQTSHGQYPGSASYLVQTDQEALDRGNWVVSNHAQPAIRVGALAFDVLTMTAAQQASMLALEPDTWIQITGLPSQTPGGTTANFIVQGFTEKLTTTEWTITANVVSRALFQAFILDNATFGTLDTAANRLYV